MKDMIDLSERSLKDLSEEKKNELCEMMDVLII